MRTWWTRTDDVRGGARAWSPLFVRGWACGAEGDAPTWCVFSSPRDHGCVFLTGGGRLNRSIPA